MNSESLELLGRFCPTLEGKVLADLSCALAAATARVEAVEAQLREVVAQAKQQLRDEQEASGVDLGKMMRRQDRMVAEMTVLRQRAEAAEAKLAAIVAVMGTPGDYCWECCTMMGVSPHTPECEIGKILEEVTG